MTSFVLVAVERPTPTTYGATRVVGPFATREQLEAYTAHLTLTEVIKVDVSAITLFPTDTPVEQFLLGR